MKILFLVPYPTGQAPSQRFRFEQYYDLLNEKKIEYKISSFIDLKTWSILYKPGNHLKKFFGLFKGYVRRKWAVLTCTGYDFIFIHREFSPLGPPVMEWMLAKVFRKKIIYDFDDAIWIPNYSGHNSFVNHLKRFANTATLCKWAHKVSCGNDYLCNYAQKFNKNVVYNPTVIDTHVYSANNSGKEKSKFVIGWTGSHSTSAYLDEIKPVIEELEMDYDFEFHVISTGEPSFNLKSLKYFHWNRETEVESLLKFSVGIMPLPDDLWAKGKCGLKALQYMALGIPALVSPVGVNAKIVDHGVNGFLCNNTVDWKNYLVKLMTDKNLLCLLSREARPKIEKYYSVKSNAANFLRLFDLS